MLLMLLSPIIQLYRHMEHFPFGLSKWWCSIIGLTLILENNSQYDVTLTFNTDTIITEVLKVWIYYITFLTPCDTSDHDCLAFNTSVIYLGSQFYWLRKSEYQECNSQWSGIELTTLQMIGTDRTSKCKSRNWIDIIYFMLQVVCLWCFVMIYWFKFIYILLVSKR